MLQRILSGYDMRRGKYRRKTDNEIPTRKTLKEAKIAAHEFVQINKILIGDSVNGKHN